MKEFLYFIIPISIIAIVVNFIRRKKENGLINKDTEEESDLLIEIWVYIADRFSKKK